MPLTMSVTNKKTFNYPNCFNDHYWDNVILLMHMNSENKIDVFIEETGKTIINHNSKILSTKSKFNDCSGYFNGTNSYLTSTHSDYILNTNNFTIEFWFYQLIFGNNSTLFSNDDPNSLIGGLRISIDTNNILKISINNTNILISSTTAFLDNSWNHLALVKEDNYLYLFLNGNIVGSSADNNNYNIGSIIIGGYVNNYFFNGHIDEFRITKGIARYSHNPTKLLMHFNNEIDEGFKEEVSGLYVTGNNGGIKLSDKPKFGVTSLYNAGAMHSSLAYTEGMNLSSSDDFTIEFWFYRPNDAVVTVILSKGDGFGVEPGFDWAINFYNGNFNFYWTQTNNSTTSLLSCSFPEFNSNQNTWHHLAIVRQGNNLKHFINGTIRANQIISTAITNRYDRGLAIGSYGDNSYNSTCYIDELRISKGIARYTTDILPSDAFSIDANTSVLCHFNGTINSQNFIFKDETSKAITPAGNVSIFSNNSAIGTTSTLFNSASNYLSYAGSPDLVFGTGDFTVECWIYLNEFGLGNGGSAIFDFRSGDASQPYLLEILGPNAGYFGRNCFLFYQHNGSVFMTSGIIPQLKTWYHIAIVRNNSVTNIYINGISYGNWPDTLDYTTGNHTVLIGRLYGGDYFNGYMNELRISKGIARYTSNFAPSTTKFTVDGYTSLLCHFDSFNSSGIPVEETGKVFTKVGNLVLANSASKFGNAVAYFDGAGDSLTIPSTNTDFVLTGDFVIEGWVYPLSYANYGTIFELNHYTNGILFRFNGSTDGVYVNGVNYGGITQYIPLNTWTFFALQRRNTTISLFINNNLVLSFSVSGTINSTNGQIRLGGSLHAGAQHFNGFIDEFKLSKGKSFYTGSGDVVLMHFVQQTGFIEETGRKISPVGNTVIDTTKKKFNSSVKFDGNGDYINIPYSSDFTFGTNNFTIECWVYADSWVGWQRASYRTSAMLCDPGTYWAFGPLSDGILGFYSWTGAANVFFSTQVLTNSIWHHIAIVKSGSSFLLFIDGNLDSTHVAVPVNGSGSQGLVLGADPPQSGYITGNIEDLRISNIARYTSNFSVPTNLHVLDSNTKLLCHFNGVDGGLFKEDTGKNITSYGTPDITNVQYKFGGYSCYLDGSSSLRIPDVASLTNDFTIDFWINFNNISSTNQYIIDTGTNSSVLRWTGSWEFRSPNISQLLFSYTHTPILNRWYHVALVRKLSEVKLYLDGVAVANCTYSDAISISQYLSIGNYGGGGNYGLYGYIDEFRITNGKARYTSNFTIPSSPNVLENFQVLDNFGNPLPPTSESVYEGEVISISNDIPPISKFPSCRK